MSKDDESTPAKLTKGIDSDMCKQQKEAIADLKKNQLKFGETWFLISAEWYKKWKAFVGYDVWDQKHVGSSEHHPGEIDNSPLVDVNTGGRRENMEEMDDYEAVPEEAWKNLTEWYGAKQNAALPCRVIQSGLFVKYPQLEVYPLRLNLYCYSDSDNLVPKNFSRDDKVSVIEREVRNTFGIANTREVRMWIKINDEYEPLKTPDKTLHKAGLHNGQFIISETRNGDGTWPLEVSLGNYDTSYTSKCSRGAERLHDK